MAADYPDWQPNPFVPDRVAVVACVGGVDNSVIAAPGVGHRLVLAGMVCSAVTLNTTENYHFRRDDTHADVLFASFASSQSVPIPLFGFAMPDNAGLECFPEAAAVTVTVFYSVT